MGGRKLTGRVMYHGFLDILRQFYGVSNNGLVFPAGWIVARTCAASIVRLNQLL